LDDVSQIPGCIEQCEKFKDEFAEVWDNWLKA
jgi:hypothetical protein